MPCEEKQKQTKTTTTTTTTRGVWDQIWWKRKTVNRSSTYGMRKSKRETTERKTYVRKIPMPMKKALPHIHRAWTSDHTCGRNDLLLVELPEGVKTNSEPGRCGTGGEAMTFWKAGGSKLSSANCRRALLKSSWLRRGASSTAKAEEGPCAL